MNLTKTLLLTAFTSTIVAAVACQKKVEEPAPEITAADFAPVDEPGEDATADPAPVRVEPPVLAELVKTDSVEVDDFADFGGDAMPKEDEAPQNLFDEEALANKGTVDDQRQLARVLMDEEKAGEAIEVLRKVLFLEESASSWSELGAAYLAADEERRGMACLEEAVAKSRFQFDDRITLAKRYMALGEIENARTHATAVAINRIDDAEANFVAGETYLKSNMWREAATAFERVVNVEPENKFARNKLGFAALQIGEDALALRHLEETLDLEPTAYMMNNLGLAYERMDQEIDAFAAYLRAVEMNPGYVKAMVNRDRIGTELDDGEKQLAMDIVEELKTARTPTAVAQADDDQELGE